MFYYEQRSGADPTGWTPRTSMEAPKTKDGRLLTADGVGPSIRRLVRVPERLQGLTLEEKRAQADQFFEGKER